MLPTRRPRQLALDPVAAPGPSQPHGARAGLSGRIRNAGVAALARSRAGVALVWPFGARMTPGQRLAALARLVALGVPVVQVTMLLWAIWTRTASVPFWDEWKMTNIVERANDGTLSLADLWALHNEHRPLIQRLIDLGLIDLTHWNRQVMMTFDLAVAIAAAALLLWSARVALGSRDWGFALLAPLSLLLLSWGQWENWFWPWQLGFIGIGFGTALCFRAVIAKGGTSRSWGRLTIALVGALVASLSSAGGLVVWIGFAPAIWRMGYRKLALWIGSGAVVWALYLVGFHRAFTDVATIPQMAAYAIAYLGAPLGGGDIQMSELFGIVGVVMLAANLILYFRLRRTIGPLMVWLSLALYALGNDAVTTYGRAFMGPAEAVSSRYQIFSAVWWVSLFIISALVIQAYSGDMQPGRLSPREWLRAWLRERSGVMRAVVALNVVALLVACGAALLANERGLRTGLAVQHTLQGNQQCIVDYQTASDACLGTYDALVEKDQLLGWAAYLQHHRLAIWYTDPGDANP